MCVHYRYNQFWWTSIWLLEWNAYNNNLRKNKQTNKQNRSAGRISVHLNFMHHFENVSIQPEHFLQLGCIQCHIFCISLVMHCIVLRNILNQFRSDLITSWCITSCKDVKAFCMVIVFVFRACWASHKCWYYSLENIYHWASVVVWNSDINSFECLLVWAHLQGSASFRGRCPALGIRYALGDQLIDVSDSQ